MDVRQIKREVDQLRRARGINRVEDCFPAWYLQRRFTLAETAAMMQSSDPAHEGATKGHDFGLDAFHLHVEDGKPLRLVLVQSKYTESLPSIGKGFRDLERALPVISRLLNGDTSDVPIENKLIVNMRAALNRVDEASRRQVAVELTVIHLAADDDEIVALRTSRAREDLKSACAQVLPDHVCTIAHVGPKRMSFDGADDTVIPETWQRLALNAVPLSATHDAKPVEMLYGIGRLAELVELYRGRRDDLFEKNVRFFISKASNIERGPSAKMRETLKEIAIDKSLEPELFAFFHNGVTLFADQVRPSDGAVEVRRPYVLNGCQTVKSAYLFFSDPRNRGRIDEQVWGRIAVPIRVTTTRDQGFIRQVTVNTNRQNSMSSAALRANDDVQLSLQERFRSAKIFYERQEGAFGSVQDSNPEFLEEEYENSLGRRVNIVDLARSLSAVAGGTELHDYAHHPNRIFDDDKAYARCFHSRRLHSVTLLTFLQNLHDVLPLVLKRDLGLSQDGAGPRPSQLGFYVMCLLMRYLAKAKSSDLLVEYGRKLWGKDRAFREEMRLCVGNHRSGIKGVLTEKFLSLPDRRNESLKTAFGRGESSLRLGPDIDVFEAFSALDDENDTD